MTDLFTWHDALAMALHFMLLSVMAVGGAVSTAPEMQRFVVTQQHWLTHGQFNASIALAQAAPGPNLLFVTLVGWQIGWQAGLRRCAADHGCGYPQWVLRGWFPRGPGCAAMPCRC